MVLFIFFAPYRAEVKGMRMPWATITVVLLCLLVHLNQERNEGQILSLAETYCQTAISDEDFGKRLGRVWRYWDWKAWDVKNATPEKACKKTVVLFKAASSTSSALKVIQRRMVYTDFDQHQQMQIVHQVLALNAGFVAPTWVAHRTWTEVPSWNVWRWITGQLSHADWEHIFFNLLFFVTVAIGVEALIGPVYFGLVILGLLFGVSLTDNLVHLNAPNIHRSVGFSGVVSGIMAMFAVLLPLARVRFFYWFFAIVGSVSFPGLVVVAWFVGWDMWYLASNVHNGVSYLAHVAGALWGAAFALLFFWKRRHWSQDSSDVLEVTTNGRNIQQYDTGVKWFFKTWESVMAVPMYLGIFYLTSLWLMAMIVQFITSHPFKMLFLIPFLMSWIHIRRERKRVRPDHEHFKDAMADIDASHYKFGVAELERLAARGYTKAQVALGQLYATGKGVPRIDNKAAEWYRQAADAGSADALYALGLMMMNGRVVRQTPDEEDVLIEKAAKRGLPEAAMTLAWRFNNRKERDVEQAAYWYHRAGERFLQQGKRDDAMVALRELDGLVPDHALTRELGTRLGVPVAG